MSRATTAPPNAESLSACMPQVGASSHEIRLHPAGQERDRDQQPGDEPDRVLEHVPDRPAGAEAHDDGRHHEAEQADRDDRRRDREREEQRVLELQRDAEQEAAPEQRRDERVDPDRRVAIVIGSSTDQKGVGAATSSSSTPCQRWRWIASAAPTVVIDQMPITVAPSEASSSVRPARPRGT